MITKEQAGMLALEFLEAHTVGTIGTANLDLQPLVSPVYYVVRPDFSIYFLTSHHTLKFRNLTVNPKVSFSVGTGPEYKVVQVTGEAHATDEEERVQVMKELEKRIGTPMASWPIKKVDHLEKGGVALFKITPAEVTYLDLNSEDQLDAMVKYYYKVYP